MTASFACINIIRMGIKLLLRREGKTLIFYKERSGEEPQEAL
jgi:hypothetical protein